MKSVLAVLFCLILLVSSLLLAGALFLRQLVFNTQLYAGVIAGPSYQPLVKNAILDDLERQANYVGIPLEVLAAGLDDSRVYMMQRQHIENLVTFLNFQDTFRKPVYPADLFREPLQRFIEDYAAAEKLTITEQQLELLDEVAASSAEIVQTHTTLIDLGQLEGSSTFQHSHRLVYDLSHRLSLAVFSWLAALLGLILLNTRAWRSWLNQILTTFWLCGSLMLVPTLVLDRFALHQRLALETPYLRVAVSRLLQRLIQFFLFWGGSLFALSSVALMVLFLTRPGAGSKKKETAVRRPAGRTG